MKHLMHHWGILLVFIWVTTAPCAFASDEYAGVVGHYMLENPSNDWHYVAINTAPDRAPFAWVNRAGKRWTVGEGQKGKPGGERELYLTFGEDSPYPGHTLDIVRDAKGKVTGLKERLENGHSQLWKRQENESP